MNSKGWMKHVFGYLLILVPWIILLTNIQLQWLEFANVESGRYFSLIMVVLSSLGCSVLTGGLANNIKYFVIALLAQLGLLFIGGSIGILDAGEVEGYTQATSMWYALDGLSGFAQAIAGLDGIVGIIAKAIPLVVLVIGVIGILVADSPDEYVTPMVETLAAVILMAIFYGLGNWIGFV
jgi:hypothetical protein